MLKQLLLAQLLCGALIISANAAPAAKIRSVMPEAEKYGLMPSRDFIGDMCRILNDSFQMVPWPIRSDGICDNLGLNIPDREAELCPMFDVAKMLLSFLQSSYPMQCSPDGIPAPSDRDPSGGHCTYAHAVDWASPAAGTFEKLDMLETGSPNYCSWEHPATNTAQCHSIVACPHKRSGRGHGQHCKSSHNHNLPLKLPLRLLSAGQECMSSMPPPTNTCLGHAVQARASCCPPPCPARWAPAACPPASPTTPPRRCCRPRGPATTGCSRTSCVSCPRPPAAHWVSGRHLPIGAAQPYSSCCVMASAMEAKAMLEGCKKPVGQVSAFNC